jgi:ankyrin repeat protein
MFPNPHDALPLPPRPNLEHYKKRAKDLLKASRSPDPTALRTWAAIWIDSLARLSSVRRNHNSVISSEVAASQSETATQSRDLLFSRLLFSRIDHWTDELEKFARKELPPPTLPPPTWGRTHSSVPPSKARRSKRSATPTLATAQFVLARAHGFESWPKLAKHIAATTRANSPVNHFEQAADAIVTGATATLEELLCEHPALVRAHSTRRHQATLLHYISANGIEGYRQKTPNNIVRIAELLLHAGADVNAVADVYAGSTTLTLVATSLHPERAGVQDALLQLLLDHGATIDTPTSASGSTINACLANGRIHAAEFLASRGAPLDLEAAAGLGRLDVVKSFFNEPAALHSNTAQEQKERALLWACEYGRNTVVDFLLDRGVPIQAQANTGQTALHWAVIGGHEDAIALLLTRGAQLEAKNAYGGTALDQALWSATHADSTIDYVHIAEVLKHHPAKS